MKKVIDLSFACSFLSVVFFLNFVIFTFSNAYELLEGFIIDEKYLTSFHKSLKNSCNNNNLNKIRQHSSYPKFGSIEGWKKICEETISKLSATSIKDMGKVMGELKKQHADEIDFARAGALLKQSLNK